MPLPVVIGIFVAQLAIGVALGTTLLYLSSRCWRAPAISWRRAFALCLVLVATGVCGVVALWLAAAVNVTQSQAGNLVQLVFLLVSIILATSAIKWYWVKRFTRTGVARSLAIWLSAWIPLTISTWVIAFACRNNLLETFIIPTGSMAPNIIGVHGNRVCSNCGWPFTVSLSLWDTRGPRAPRLERRPLATVCGNCRERHSIELDTVLHRGDRIAVDKLAAVQRWSIVVFRKPPERKETHLKRLVGLPGESVELAGGEVFINGELLRKDPQTATDLWLPVHDTRFSPKRRGSQTPRWQRRDDPSALPDASGVWTLEAREDDRASLDFAGGITDLLDYNDDDPGLAPPTHENFVGDVLLSCAISELNGGGTFGVDWQFRGDQLTIEISSAGNVAIQATSARESEHQQVAASARLERPVAAGDSLSFAVRDGQAYFLLNNVVAASARFGPDKVEAFRGFAAAPAEPCELSIWAHGCSLTFEHITLKRDVYYIGDSRESGGSGPMRGGNGRPVDLGASEYYSLADNSARGLDSRFYGDLQASDIIGVARWIYWPVNRWHELSD